MRFLADESCDFSVVRALRAAGHDVETVTETCRGAPDEIVTQLSVQTRRILLTEDKDFGQLVSLLQNSLSVRIFPIGMEFSSRRAIKLVESVL